MVVGNNGASPWATFYQPSLDQQAHGEVCARCADAVFFSDELGFFLAWFLLIGIAKPDRNQNKEKGK